MNENNGSFSSLYRLDDSLRRQEGQEILFHAVPLLGARGLVLAGNHMIGTRYGGVWQPPEVNGENRIRCFGSDFTILQVSCGT